jgi:hypothetical protein
VESIEIAKRDDGSAQGIGDRLTGMEELHCRGC